MIDDERLRSILVVRAARATDVDLAATARAIARDPRTRSRRFTRRALTLGAAAALTLAGATIGLIIVSSPPMPTHIATSAPSSSVLLPEGVEPWPGLTWSAVVPGESRVASVVEWSGGFVGAWSTYDQGQDRHTAYVWTTEDGRAWDRAAELPDVSVFRVVAWEGELVLVGHYHTPGMWRSADGATWTELAMPDDWMDLWQPIDIIIGPDDWLFGGVITFDGPGIQFRGRPGGDWSLVEPDADAFAEGVVYDSLAGEEVWVAAGAAGHDPDAPPQPSNFPRGYLHGAIWWSTDGRDWTAATVDRPGRYVTQVSRVAGGWVAVGGDDDFCPGGCNRQNSLIWQSTDGRSWHQVDLGPVEGTGFQGLALRGDGHRGLVFDTVAGQLRVRETFDGIAWREVPIQSAAGLPLNNLFHRSSPVVGSNAIVAFWADQVYVAVPGPVPG